MASFLGLLGMVWTALRLDRAVSLGEDCSFRCFKVVTDLDELSAIPREVESYLP
jgi:hypothetical protein